MVLLLDYRDLLRRNADYLDEARARSNRAVLYTYQGNYGGVLTDKSGTLTGTQAWTMPEGQQSRACTAALVRNAAIAE